jgi:hypothetical protein
LRVWFTNKQDTDIEGLKKAFQTMAHLDEIWQGVTAERKRLIINSIFPEKLVFDRSTFQTAPLIEGARLIYSLNKGLAESKYGQKQNLSALSIPVTLPGIEPMKSRITFVMSKHSAKYLLHLYLTDA